MGRLPQVKHGCGATNLRGLYPKPTRFAERKLGSIDFAGRAIGLNSIETGAELRLPRYLTGGHRRLQPKTSYLQAGRLRNFFRTSALDESTHRLAAAEFAKQRYESYSPSGFVGPVVQV
jgi:hypothetical protein